MKKIILIAMTIMASTLLCHAQTISEEETVQLLRKVANLQSFLSDPKEFPEDKIGSETYKRAVEYILFHSSRFQDFTIDGDHVTYEQRLIPEHHNTTTTSEYSALDAKGNLVKYKTATDRDWVDDEDVLQANNCMANYSLYYLFDPHNPYALHASCYKMPKPSILYSWLFMMCRYHLEETMYYDGKPFFDIEKTPEEFQERFVENYQNSKIKETAYDSIDDKILDILDYHRSDLNSEIRVFNKAWLTFYGVKTGTIKVCLHKGELQEDDFDLSGKTDDEIANTAYYVNAYPFAIALAYKKDIHITKWLDESVNVDVPYEKVIDIVRNSYTQPVFHKKMKDNPCRISGGDGLW